ncbi:hypothetical protein EV182_003304 [Spiromyces aspiralis]|uniref:Uncharacterized protein n=1 Tax=Spiromyces aspiralis TaxID=68401 RepID=A0ACC1HH45_9FUNG|nr:hypothetical protein EV182_003304 [Spiromyces aspiralis]
MTQYILRCVRKKYRRASLPLERLGEELEAYVTSRNRGNVLPSRVYLLVNDLPVGSRDRVIQAISMIAEKQRAAVGDVNVLYKAYSIPSADSDSSRPPADLLRDPIIMEPLLQETFEFYGDPRIDGSSITESQASNFIWLIAYASVYSDGLANGALEEELEVTQAVLRDIRTLLNSRMTTTSINKVMPKILEWMDLPIAALVLVAWVGALIKDDQYSFYQSYYRTTEIPLPLVILEEIAHRHPLLQQHVFSIYIDTFQARINMMPELLLALQKMTLDRLLNLLQMGYVIPVLRYIHHQQLKMDESQVVYFINKASHVLASAAVKEGNEGQVDGVLSPDYFHLANDLYARVKAGK